MQWLIYREWALEKALLHAVMNSAHGQKSIWNSWCFFSHKIFHRSGKVEPEMKECKETGNGCKNTIVYSFKDISGNKAAF